MTQEANNELPYIEIEEFNKRVATFAETNYVLKNLFNNPKSHIKSWEQLPPHLIQDLFNKLGCKPTLLKY